MRSVHGGGGGCNGDSDLVAAVEAKVRARGGDPSRRESKFRCPNGAQHSNGDADASAGWNSEKRCWHCPVCGEGGGYVDLARWLGLLDATRGNSGNGGKSKPSAVYPIKDATGRVVATHRRYDLGNGEKRFTWPKGTKPAALPLYGVHELAGVPKGATVVVTEGEKARDALAAHGIVAVGTVTGASGTPLPDVWRDLDGFDVVLWADADAAGYEHMARAAVALSNLGIAPRAVVWWDGAPEGGDAHDWFASGRSVEDLRALIAAAPEWAPSASETSGDADAGITWMADLIREPDEQVDWIVDGLLPAGGTSIIAAKPKTGKSTLMRHLAFAVSRGETILGRTTQAAPVFYVAHEGRRADVRTHLRQLEQTSGAGPLATFVGQAPHDPVAWLRDAIVRHGFKLVVIDTIGRFAGLRDANDYAEVSKFTGPLIGLANDTGCHIAFVHHAAKGDRSGTDAVLGSTAFAGAVDTILIMKRGGDQARTLETIQRSGSDLAESVVTLDKATGRVDLGGGVEETQVARIVEALLSVVGPGVRTEREIRGAVEGKTTLKNKALREACRTGKLQRRGAGGVKDPYRYFRADEAPEDDVPGTAEQSEQREQSMGGEGDGSDSVPRVPLFPEPPERVEIPVSPPSARPPGNVVPLDRAEAIKRAVALFGAEPARRRRP